MRLLGEDEIPIAVAGQRASAGQVISIHRHTGAIALLWTEASDWTLPLDWQVSRKPWSPTLAGFLADQIALYR